MLTKTFSAAILAIDAIPVTIEIMSTKGVGFTIVGLPDAAVKDGYQRILTALEQSNVGWRHRRIVINLAPADIKKEGAGFDLPMAVGMLAANELIPADRLGECMIIGELSLDGGVLPVKGALPIAVLARKMGFKKLIVPVDNVTEAAVVNNIDVYGVSTLTEAINIVTDNEPIAPTRIDTRRIFAEQSDNFDFDFSEVKGQETVKRAFEVACAGGHNILMV